MAELRFDSILVATDLSPASRAAYAHAVTFGRAFDSTISLLHVDESDDPEGPSVPQLAEQWRRAAEARDQELERVEASFGGFGLDVTVERTHGSAYKAILERMESDRCDLVIIAKHGVRESDPGAMGTTAERVMHHADVPVVIGYAVAPGLHSAASYERLTVSTDYSEDSVIGVRRVLQLATAFDAAVEVLHAITLPGDAKADWGSIYADAQLEHLNQRLAEDIGDSRARGRIHAGLRVPETVIEGARQGGADMLCVPTHGKGAIRRALFGSVADRVMRMAPMPAMIMPRRWLRG